MEDAIDQILTGINERLVLRKEKWNRNHGKNKVKVKADASAGDGEGEGGKEKVDPTPTPTFRGQDETVELSLCLNLDPQRPGQALRGSLPLPHGTGKKVNIVVFCSDEDTETIQLAKSSGATIAGGASVIEGIANGSIPISNVDRSLSTPDMMSALSKIARVLGPRGLMPNAKLSTIQPKERLGDAIVAQAAGMVQYRTDKNGNIMAGVGKGSFDKVSINIYCIV